MLTPLFLNAYSKAELKHGEHQKNKPNSGVNSNTLPPAELHDIREALKTIVDDENIPSLAVGAAMNGEIIWQEAFGWADIENQRSADAHTMYSIASITKPMTATAIMVLAERGMLDLDEPVNKYLKGAKLTDYSGKADNVTIRQVLNHTSGLPLHYHFFYEDDTYERPTMEESINRYGKLMFEPGERYLYSNMGYGILDHVIRSVSGQSYTEFMQNEIFNPLGMNRTAVGIPSDLHDYQAVRYGNDLKPLPFYDFDHRGASAVYSSVHDLLRFGMFAMGTLMEDQKEILSESARASMITRSTLTGVDDSTGYGLGWSVKDHKSGLHEVWHSGGMGGVRTMLLLIPEINLVVTVLHNSNNGSGLRIAREIAQKMYPGRFDNFQSNHRNQDLFDPTPVVGSWSGQIKTYKGELDVLMEINQKGAITISLNNEKPVKLNRVQFDEYGYLKGVFLGNIDTDDANRDSYSLYLNARSDTDRISGSVTAIASGSKRIGFALSSYLDLKKLQDQDITSN